VEGLYDGNCWLRRSPLGQRAFARYVTVCIVGEMQDPREEGVKRLTRTRHEGKGGMWWMEASLVVLVWLGCWRSWKWGACVTGMFGGRVPTDRRGNLFALCTQFGCQSTSLTIGNHDSSCSSYRQALSKNHIPSVIPNLDPLLIKARLEEQGEPYPYLERAVETQNGFLQFPCSVGTLPTLGTSDGGTKTR
jgi:hypothetical protein